MDDNSLNKALREKWLNAFEKAVQSDQWGQIVEAQDSYDSLAAEMAQKSSTLVMKNADIDTIYRLVLCISARYHALLHLTDVITANDMKKLVKVFEKLFDDSAEQNPLSFPIEARKYAKAKPVRPFVDKDIALDITLGEDMNSDFQTTHDAIQKIHGSVLMFRIQQIGLKDAQTYMDPKITVLVVDRNQQIMARHETAVANERRVMHVLFNETIYLGVSYEECTRAGATFFFEFTHYKPKKKKISTRCWAMMELSELRTDEEILLEIYHKPIDFMKKRLRLHSEKSLYLHLQASIINQ